LREAHDGTGRSASAARGVQLSAQSPSYSVR
jgi:hypothetical protein